MESVADYAIFLLDVDGVIQSWNEGAQRFKGYTAAEAIGKHFSVFYPEGDIRSGKPKWELEEAALTGRFEDEGWRLRKDGTQLWANVVITALRNEAGALIGFSKVTRDMTDRRRLEEKLRRSNEELDQRVIERTAQLERAVRSRDEFMSIVSHELKTPVTSLQLQVQTAARQFKLGNADLFREKAEKFIFGAGRQIERLSRLIEDMFDVSRIAMDKLRIVTEALELAEVVREAVERFESQAEVAQTSLDLSVESTGRVNADRLRLEQVFSNLLMNALKYGERKPITVIVRRDGDFLCVVVQDRGMGISPGDQGRIFQRFERAVSASAVSGLGLGLYISQKIVEAHGGTIAVRSAVGQGSEFVVSLPALPDT